MPEREEIEKVLGGKILLFILRGRIFLLRKGMTASFNDDILDS